MPANPPFDSINPLVTFPPPATGVLARVLPAVHPHVLDHRRGARELLERLEAWDPPTGAHCRRVGGLAEGLARRAGFDATTVSLARIAGHVHDVGKLGTPREVLSKDGRLTDGEFRRIKLHAEDGELLTAACPGLRHVSTILRHHHERWDGSGYPDGLAGTDTPLVSRIISVVDTWDAITECRSYERRRPAFLALTEIRKGAGSQFDPALAATFIDMVMEQLHAVRRSA